MNIFQNRDRFFGKPNFISIHGNMDEFWKLANKIKSELGDKGYYLDKYLNVIFEMLADLDLATASSVAMTFAGVFLQTAISFAEMMRI
ncbi:MAG: hypothetical protein ACI4PR_00240 [Acutalibacteraceae bacterium]